MPNRVQKILYYSSPCGSFELKVAKIYVDALALLVDFAENCNVSLKPSYILMDFEKAAINASKEIFPDCAVFGCFFHWSQNLLKKLSSLGLKSKYSAETGLFMDIKKLQALSFLPPERIKKAYFELKGTLSDCLDQ